MSLKKVTERLKHRRPLSMTYSAQFKQQISRRPILALREILIQ